jgi:uncharacterized membrane protein
MTTDNAATSAPDPSIIVGTAERVASAVLGGGAVVYGLSRRSLGGAALAVVGAGLLYRGVTGRCPVYRALGVSTAATMDTTSASGTATATSRTRVATAETADAAVPVDRVDEASVESFPASDAPGWGSSTIT